MKILGLDTCVDACSVAVWAGGRVLAQVSEPMHRGHQERLAPMAAETLSAAGVTPSQLDRIAVTVGPGSFTGLRVGLAFAKAMALALDRPCLGFSALEVLAAGAGEGFVAACLDARRGRVFLQVFVNGLAVTAPDVLDVEIAAARICELWTGGGARLVGSGAPLLARTPPGASIEPFATPDPAVITRLAAARGAGSAPRPLYLRQPDAKAAAS